MAKSRRESPLREAFPLLSLRGAEGHEAISKDSPRGREQCLARAEAVLNVVRGFSLVQNKEHDPEGSHYRKRGSLI
jgi:hypothetical protein